MKQKLIETMAEAIKKSGLNGDSFEDQAQAALNALEEHGSVVYQVYNSEDELISREDVGSLTRYILKDAPGAYGVYIKYEFNTSLLVINT